jgi:hypothetical protein
MPDADVIPTRRRAVHCFGDSHVRIFEELSRSRALPGTRFVVTAVRGATALGLANPNSQTHALETFKREIAWIPKSRTLLFMLGEVDCGYLVWYRSQRGSGTAAQVAAESLKNYTGFLDGLIAEGRERLVVASVFLPTVEDYSTWSGLQNARREVKADIAERTRITREYNAAVRAWVNDRRCTFLDLEPSMLDGSSGLVRREFVHPDPFDHHLDPEALRPAVVDGLRRVGFR